MPTFRLTETASAVAGWRYTLADETGETIAATTMGDISNPTARQGARGIAWAAGKVSDLTDAMVAWSDPSETTGGDRWWTLEPIG